MKKNIGEFDRLIRMILGFSLLFVAYYSMGGWLKMVVFVFGMWLMWESVTSHCYLYSMMGMSTVEGRESREQVTATKRRKPVAKKKMARKGKK